MSLGSLFCFVPRGQGQGDPTRHMVALFHGASRRSTKPALARLLCPPLTLCPPLAVLLSDDRPVRRPVRRPVHRPGRLSAGLLAGAGARRRRAPV
eukprot:6487681-Prymnesium_polylepis.1